MPNHQSKLHKPLSNEEYIKKHRDEDVRSLALKKVPEGVDARWCLQQIEGWQLARKKLPRWAEADGLWFPPRLSMEQCSSEMTAEYKRAVVLQSLRRQTDGSASDNEKPSGDALIDLTGGLGIDFSYMARSFGRATYVEQQAHLCDIARHNFNVLGLDHVEVVCDTAENFTAHNPSKGVRQQHAQTTIYLDPARRDDIGRKVAALEDCTPNVIALQDTLFEHTDRVILKLSPMLDITQALRQLRCVDEVHVVSVKGECKEVLIAQTVAKQTEGSKEQAVTYHCVNLGTEDEPFVCTKEKPANAVLVPSPCELAEGRRLVLFEPNASILKAGVQDYLCEQYDIRKLHPISNLFVGERAIPGFPGRQFDVECIGDFSKNGIKHVLGGIRQANLTIRNFPATVAELRKRLKIREGGDVYVFATTLADGSHAIMRCKKSKAEK